MAHQDSTTGDFDKEVLDLLRQLLRVAHTERAEGVSNLLAVTCETLDVQLPPDPAREVAAAAPHMIALPISAN